jgi:hypothetical protein
VVGPTAGKPISVCSVVTSFSWERLSNGSVPLSIKNENDFDVYSHTFTSDHKRL